jgi:RNA polymerase sigma-70 factor (ECF subfamily)
VTSTIGYRAEDTAGADDILAVVVSDGTALSWGEVFDEYAPALTRYARSRGVREPEDLVQDVFVAAFRQLPGFAGDRSGLRSLLFTIAYRRIADHHRRGYRRPETLVAEHLPRPDPGPTVEQIVDLGESAGRAMEAFAVLSERERRVIEMRILEEDTPASVGRALGLSTGNVRVIQARALGKIRKHLRSMGEGGFALPMAGFGALSGPFRFLKSKLPTDGPVGGWIDEVRRASASTIEETRARSSSLTSAALPATGRAADTSHSLISSVVSSGTARIGAAVSAVVLSTIPVLPAIFPGAEPSSRSVDISPVVEVRERVSTPRLQPEGQTVDTTETPADPPAIDNPIPVGPGSEASGSIFDDDPTQGAAPAAGELGEAPEVNAAGVAGAVETLIADTADVLMDDVVEPVVDVVVDVVEDTVEVLETPVDIPVDETLSPLVEDLNDTVGDVVPGLGPLLGGR